MQEGALQEGTLQEGALQEGASHMDRPILTVAYIVFAQARSHNGRACWGRYGPVP